MSTRNLPCLTAAKIDCCVLANNHVLDWGEIGLRDTLHLLAKSGVATTGAGANLDSASAPAVVPTGKEKRLLVFGYGLESAGIPSEWAATPNRPGVNLLRSLSSLTAMEVSERIREVKRPGDLAIVSLHWGGNWGYRVTAGQRAFARWLIASEAVDIVHGHSSHHFRPLEIWQGKLILYGCGDFLNDYEGIAGYEQFRGDLTMMYFPTLHSETGFLLGLDLVPLQIRRMRLERTSDEDSGWLIEQLNRECAPFGSHFDLDESGIFRLRI